MPRPTPDTRVPDPSSPSPADTAPRSPATPRRVALAAATVAAVVYLLTMSRTIGFVDSGEVAAAASGLGIMHPTGYPTLTMLGFVVTVLAPVRDILALNILAALLVAAGIGILTLLFDRLIAATRPKPRAPVDAKSSRRKRRDGHTVLADPHPRDARATVAGFAALFVGFTAIWWEQATGFEVYALQSLLLPLVALQFVRFVDAERERPPRGAGFFTREGTWFALALGLAFTNHMMTVFLAPAFLVHYFWSLGIGARSLKRIVSLVPPFAAGLLPYLYLPIRSSMHPRLNWGHPDTWDRFVFHVSGKFAWEWMFSSSEVYDAQTGYFFGRLPGELAYAGLALAAVGLVVLFARNVRLAAWSALMFAACAAYAGGYRIYDVELYYATAILAIGIWVAIGLAWLVERAGARVATGIAAALAIANFVLHYAAVDESGNRLAEDFAANTLLTAPERSVIFSSSAATLVTGTLYLQLVEGMRPDVTVINHDYLSLTWYLDELATWRPDLMSAVAEQVASYRVELEKVERGEDFSSWELTQRYDAMVRAMVDWGMARGGVVIGGEVESAFGRDYRAVPWHLGYRLVRDTAYVPQDFPRYRFEHFRTADPFASSVYEAYGRRLSYRASYEAEHGRADLARRYREYALTFDPGIDPETVGPLPLDAMSQIRATAEFYARLRAGG